MPVLWIFLYCLPANLEHLRDGDTIRRTNSAGQAEGIEKSANVCSADRFLDCYIV